MVQGMVVAAIGVHALGAADCAFTFWSPSVLGDRGDIVRGSGCRTVDLSPLSSQVILILRDLHGAPHE
jgi:hypothetical protein